MNFANFYTNSQHTDTPPKGTGSGALEHTRREQTPEQLAEQRAAKLFDTMRPAEAQTEQKSGEPKSKDDEDRARAIYSPESTYQDSVLIADVPANATVEQVQQANAEYRAELNNMELPGKLARELTNTFTAAMRVPLTDAEYDAKVASFKTELARRFGSEAEERLTDVRALLAKAHPAFMDALVESGMNYDIDVVAALADHARSLKGRGRL